jgi:hypothetical protein
MANELEKHVSTWLLRVKGQTREGKDRVTAKALGDMARMLAVDFPREAFTQESMQAVAGNAPDGWFPGAYAVMRGLIDRWWAANKPASADASWPPGVDRLASYPDRQWFRHYHLTRPKAAEQDRQRVDRLGEFTHGPYRDPYDPPTDIAYSKVGQLCSLIRRYSPAAWALIRNPEGTAEPPADPAPPVGTMDDYLDMPAPTQAAIDSVAAALQSSRGLFELPPSHTLAEQRAAVDPSFLDIPAILPAGRPLTAEQLAAARATVRGAGAP